MNNQQLSASKRGKSSETISQESTHKNVETGNTLTDKAEGKDIVQKNFINKSISKFKNSFDYSLVSYKNAKTKVKIKCKAHNLVFEQTPDKHLQGNYPCPQCLSKHKSKITPLRKTKKEYKDFKFYEERVLRKFPKLNINITGEYKGMGTIVSFNCQIHGIQQSTIQGLLLKQKKYSCVKCAKNNRIVNKRKTIFSIPKQDFEIDFSNYIDRKSIVRCKCSKHGYFYKKVQNIISGQGCFKCKIEELVKNNVLVGGYSEDLFKRNPVLKDIPANLYLFKIGNLYKVGITTKNIENRIKGLKAKAKTFGEDIKITLLTSKKDSLYDCFKQEQKILQENSFERVYKKWSTELLKKIDINKYF